VAGFIGSPAMNMVDATVGRENGAVVLALGDQKLEVDQATVASRPALASFDGRKVILGIRPEHLEEASLAGETPPSRRLRGNVELREALGSELMVHFSVESASVAETDETKELAHDVGAGGGGLETKGALFVGRFGARAQVVEGEPVEVAVDTTALHFFDPDTGLGIYEQVEKGGAT
jgi:multiple sugar transport system ATP-binding protein